MCYSSKKCNVIFGYELHWIWKRHFVFLQFSHKLCLNVHLIIGIWLTDYATLKFFFFPHFIMMFQRPCEWYLQLVNFQLEVRVERRKYLEGTVLMKGIHSDLLIWVCEEAALFSDPKWCNVLAVRLSIPQYTDLDFEISVYTE